MINKLLFLFITLPVAIFAKEGMWMPNKIDSVLADKMIQMGYQLAPDSIYEIESGGISDAVIVFGPGCTGEVVSDKGLIFTNHHCGFGSIQKISTVENDYLHDGYWAKSQGEELNAPGLTVKFLRGIFEVTDEVLGCIPDTLLEEERKIHIDSVMNALKTEISDTSDLLVEIKPFYNGLQYYATFQQVYKDIRLVGTPPISIGKYGGDTDNWMWPRHTGDFSVWRIYADSLGQPAEFSENNLPLTTKTYLPISLNGVEEGDFTMTIGYPGSTRRYLSSWGIKERMNVINQTFINVRGVKQEEWSKRMAENDEIKLKYASKYFRSSNYWKNSIGMNKGLTQLKVLDKKEAQEKKILDWAKKNNREEIAKAIEELEDGYNMRADILKAHFYIRECLIRGAEIYAFSNKIMTLVNERNDTISNEPEIAETIETFFKDYDKETDKLTTEKLISYFMASIQSEFHPSFIADDVKNVESYCNKLFSKSIFTNASNLKEAIKRNKIHRLKKDIAYQGAKSISELEKELKDKMKPFSAMVRKGERALMEAKLLIDSTINHYPDANFTMRMSIGNVGSYNARDAVFYNYYTTIGGVFEKYKPGDLEFDLPQEFIALSNEADFGKYSDKKGDLRVCFISDNDITGGNSGSPILNGYGQLVGLVFDGNWEAMSGDIAFEPKLQRTISVDIRYVLFIIDKLGKCGYLLNEMEVIKNK